MNKEKDNTQELLDIMQEEAPTQESPIIDQLAAQPDTEPPINPVKQFKGSKKGAAYVFYQETAPQLMEWWDEFNTALNADGMLKYRTVIGFAKAKGKTKVERDLILEMIGPQPQVKDGRQLRVPWLGDWQKRRDNGFWAPKQTGQMKDIAVAFKQKLIGWDAVRMTTPYLVMEMASYEKDMEELKKAFGGMIFDVNQSPLSEPNQTRFKVYTDMKWSLSLKKIRLMHEYWRANGIDVDGDINMVQINALAQQITSPAGLMEGGFQPSSGTLPREELEVLKLARMLQQHAQNYNLPLPQEEEAQKTITMEPQAQRKGNGKVQ